MIGTKKIPKRIIGWVLVPLVIVAALGAWLALDPGFRGGSKPADSAGNLPRGELERRVREYLLGNPEVVIEAIERYQERKKAAEETEAQTILKARADEVFRDPHSPAGGNPDGDATLVEFFNYNCPYCRRVAPTMNEAEAGDAKLRIVYKELPILGPDSVFAARAALAAHRQGRYVAFHKALMLAEGVADQEKVMAVAAKVGLDLERLKRDMADPAIQASIDKILALARALRINGTPSFIAGDQIVRGAIDLKALQMLIQQGRNPR